MEFEIACEIRCSGMCCDEEDRATEEKGRRGIEGEEEGTGRDGYGGATSPALPQTTTARVVT